MKYFKIPVLVFTLFLLTDNVHSQNAIVGSGFTNGWNNSDFEFFSEIISGSYGRTEQANGTGDQYFRIGVNWGGTVGQHTITSGVDSDVSHNTEYTLSSSSTSSGSMKLNVSNASHNYVFKTKDAGATPSFKLIIFKIEGDIRTISSVSNNVSGKAVHNDAVTVTATLNGSLSTGQSVYLRYTDDNFSTSTLVEMSGSGTSYTATIPSSTNQVSKTIKYYTFTSGNGLTISASNADFYTINLNNNGGSNYSYDVESSVSISGNAGWRLLSLPKSGGTIADISDDSPVQGITGGSNTGSPSNFYIYDNSGAWEEPTDATTAWGDGYGFAMYFYNNTNNGSSALPVTLETTGADPSSNVSVNLYGGAANRYTLVGNPFASNYNTNSITVTGGSIQNNISFWNDAASSYSAQDRTGPYIIAPWQGFFVETSDASASSITFQTSGETTSGTSGTFFSKVADIRGDINFALTSETTNDEAIRLSFRANATPDWDLDDASKLTPLLPAYATLGFATNDMVKSVESLPYRLEEEVTLPMQLDLVGVEGEFSLGWDGLETIPDEWELILHDYEQGTSVNLRDIDEYTFEAEPEVASKRNPLTVLSMPAKSMAKASQDERFGLTVRPVSVGNEEELSPYSFTLDQNYPNPFNPKTNITYSLEQAGLVSLEIYNALGQRVTQLVNKSQSPGRYNVQWDASVAPTGIYYYRLEVGGVSLTRKMTLIK